MELSKIEQQRILLERQGLDIKSLARKMNFDQSTIYRYFNNVMTRKSAKAYYEEKIDAFLTANAERVNPETDGGGE